MDQQVILACDDNGNFLEYIPKQVGHTGAGKRHLAVTVLIYSRSGEILLQRRKHKVFNNIWDLTASTHPLHKLDGIDETIEEACMRALKEEWGIENASLKRIGEFNYFAKTGPLCENQQAVFCENEHDVLLIGEYNGEVKLNPDVGYEYKWVDKKEFIKDVEKSFDQYTPWAIEGVKILKEKKFF